MADCCLTVGSIVMDSAVDMTHINHDHDIHEIDKIAKLAQCCDLSCSANHAQGYSMLKHQGN